MLKKSLALHCNGHTIIQPKNVHDKANVTLGVTWYSDKNQELRWVGRVYKKKYQGRVVPPAPKYFFFPYIILYVLASPDLGATSFAVQNKEGKEKTNPLTPQEDAIRDHTRVINVENVIAFHEA